MLKGYVEVKTREEWDRFLDWYKCNVGEYDWYPITMADRVNIYDSNRYMVAYWGSSPFGELYSINEVDYDKYSNYVNAFEKKKEA